MQLSFKPISLDEISLNYYDGVLGCVGYESRSSYFFSRNTLNAQSGAFFVFDSQRVLSFDSNLHVFESLQYEKISATRQALTEWFDKLASTTQTKDEIKLLVDISSVNRKLIATICLELGYLANRHKCNIAVDFVYSLAEFGIVPNIEGPLLVNGPCLDDFGGWHENPSSPCGIILGIGYEEDLALGILEELEAADVWAFRPRDHDPRYDLEIDNRNRGLFLEIPPANTIHYSVFDPLSILASLNSLMSVSKHDYRLIVVPFGPKIFALTSCLAAMYHYPNVGIWRVSAEINLTPVDRQASGQIVSFSTIFS